MSTRGVDRSSTFGFPTNPQLISTKLSLRNPHPPSTDGIQTVNQQAIKFEAVESVEPVVLLNGSTLCRSQIGEDLARFSADLSRSSKNLEKSYEIFFRYGKNLIESP